ncbi:MAG: hypothetical protein A3B68_04640 [Candidatus Melainabacteria bacterium RIFCSPHIGHO2_02_FULL_34_12]|nr:MAG: hypothetical protein A3B68_04640 [Candidatus Melainabacteria bacterium RIFCSPHIGHO2_02_FULL_34_12]
MFYHEFEWDDGNEPKVSIRASLEEVESAFYDRKKKTLRTYFNRYEMYARTGSGRYLFVVYQRKAGGIIRVISVRNMTRNNKRYYRRK